MATYKIMLVEDDNNLRAIYGDRLMAEGYEIVSARDGEEALAMAVKEKPNLIISDVMMPKISGFDMLDILRTTPETKDVKVIMMTALSQAEDKERADKLGADKYLVKSQVTLEDVARVVHEVLGDEAGAAPAVAEAPVVPEQAAAAPATVAVEPVAQQVVAAPVAAPANPFEAPSLATVSPAPVADNPFSAPQAAMPAPEPVQVPAPVPQAVQPDMAATRQIAAAPMQPVVAAPDPMVVASPGLPDLTTTAPVLTPDPVAPVTSPSQADPVIDTAVSDPVVTSDDAAVVEDQSAGSKRVIQPISNITDPSAQPKIYELYEKEIAAQAGGSPEVSVAPSAEAPLAEAPEAPQPTPAPSSAPQEPSSTTPGASFDPNSVAL